MNPITGPLSREEWQEIVAAPHGQAKKLIRKHDPFWGLENGEKIPFRVEVSGRISGTATVMAATQKEAEKLADALTDMEVDWGCGGDDFDIIAVEPRK